MSAASIPTSSSVPSGRADRRPPFSRYDLVLAAIPIAFLFALAGAAGGLVDVTTAVALASVGSAAALVDALFVNPPLDGR